MIFLIFFVIISPAFIFNIGAAEEHQTDYEALYKELMELEPDKNLVAKVQDFSFRRDAGVFDLKKGKLYLCKPINGRVVAALFEGKGRFRLTPPTEIERRQVRRFYEADSLDQEFKFLVLIFADSTLKEFQSHLNFSRQRVSHQLKKQIKNCLRYMGDEKGKNFEPEFIKTFLENATNSLFYAHFSKNSLKPMFFKINPYEVEEVRFMRRPKNDSVTYRREMISQFHQQSDYEKQSNLAHEDKKLIDVESYRIECWIENNSGVFASSNPNFRAKTEMIFRPITPPDKEWLFFYISPKLEVDSISWKSGTPVDFFKSKDNHLIWIRADSLQIDTTYQLNLSYHGEIIQRYDDYFMLDLSTFWYPRQSFHDKSQFDLYFHVPDIYKFTAAGHQDTAFVDNAAEDGYCVTRWRTYEPIRNASFSMGIFDKHVVENDTLPRVTVYMNKTRRAVRAKRVGEEIARSIDFFREVYGESRADEFFVMETPTLHGESFLGLTNLSGVTFIGDDPWGYDAIHRAHEAAHQWWGVGVDFLTYHDQWMSEGFADYSGLWYLEIVREDQKNFLKKLKDWRKLIVENRQYLLGDGVETGPIWLGYRTVSSETKEDYAVVIYKKGAWILHLLRCYLLDPADLNDDQFRTLMRDFYETYLHRQATTEDFQHFIEDYIHEDMDWFFQQWVYASDIPTYKFAYKQKKTAEGKYLIRFRSFQENAPGFRSSILVTAKMIHNDYQRQRIWITDGLNEFELPLLDSPPEEIIFGDFESALADIKKVDWDELSP